MNTITGGSNKLLEKEVHQPLLDFNFSDGLHLKNAQFSGPGTELI